jgi:hypothetical protein
MIMLKSIDLIFVRANYQERNPSIHLHLFLSYNSKWFSFYFIQSDIEAIYSIAAKGR